MAFPTSTGRIVALQEVTEQNLRRNASVKVNSNLRTAFSWEGDLVVNHHLADIYRERDSAWCDAGMFFLSMKKTT